MVSRTIRKDLVCPGRMHSLKENGKEKLTGYLANPGSPRG